VQELLPALHRPEGLGLQTIGHTRRPYIRFYSPNRPMRGFSWRGRFSYPRRNGRGRDYVPVQEFNAQPSFIDQTPTFYGGQPNEMPAMG